MPDTQSPSLLRRLAAMLYDGLLILALLFIAIFLVVIPAGLLVGWDQFDPAALRSNPLYIGYLLLVPPTFLIWFWTHGGQTLGMRAWRIRLVGMDGTPVTLKQGVIRYLASLLSWLPFGLGFLWSLFDRERLTWHDRLSGTRLERL